jgi:hypothetical protein
MLFWLDKRRQLSLSSAFGGFMRANVSQKLHKNARVRKFCKNWQSFLDEGGRIRQGRAGAVEPGARAL